MATTPTNLPIPSESPKDLKFNAGKIDEFVNALTLKYIDRFGIERFTAAGLENLVRQIVSNLGLVPFGTFETGATLTDATQTLKYGSDGNYYRWDGDFPKVVPADSTPDSTGGVAQGAWVNVTDLTLRTALASDDGAKLIGGLNYVTPEMSGIETGAGIESNDTAALQWAFNQNAALVMLDSTKTYNIIPNAIQHTGAINVFAGLATIVCDGVFLEVIDGPDSKWTGGILKSKSTPYTVVYNSDFTISEQGFLGYGMMPNPDEANDGRVHSAYKFQQISCALFFRSSDGTVISGLEISGVKGKYANIVVGGYANTKFTNCEIIGGNMMGGIALFNDTKEQPLWGYTNHDSPNSYKFGRGYNHRFINCKSEDSNNNGFYVSGSDDVLYVGCVADKGGESGFKTAQYTVRDWSDTDMMCTDVTYLECDATGCFYDGFDVQNAFGSGAGTIEDSSSKVVDCTSTNNRRTGIVGQGGKNEYRNNTISGNGSHGIISARSSHVLIDNCHTENNALITGGYEILLLGPDSIMKNCTAYHTATGSSFSLIRHEAGTDIAVSHFAGINEDNVVDNWSLVTIGSDINYRCTRRRTSADLPSHIDGNHKTVSGVKYPLIPLAGNVYGNSVASEAGAVAAWRHPYSPSVLFRLRSNTLTETINAPVFFSRNRGVNSTATTGYADDSGQGGTEIGYYQTSWAFNIYAAGNPLVPVGGYSVDSQTFRPNIDNTLKCGDSAYRFTQVYAVNGTINTSDKRHKTSLRDATEVELEAFYEISKLPSVWRWLERYQTEGDDARLHSGPTVQDAIEVMTQYDLDWRRYSAFCYDKWDAWEGGENPETGNFEPPREAGEIYSFRKDELLLWFSRAQSAKIDIILSKVS